MPDTSDAGALLLLAKELAKSNSQPNLLSFLGQLVASLSAAMIAWYAALHASKVTLEGERRRIVAALSRALYAEIAQVRDRLEHKLKDAGDKVEINVPFLAHREIFSVVFRSAGRDVGLLRPDSVLACVKYYSDLSGAIIRENFGSEIIIFLKNDIEHLRDSANNAIQHLGL